MVNPPVVVTPEMSISDMVSRVFDCTDLRPSTRRTYVHAAKAFIAWAGSRPLDPMILADYKNALRARTDLAAKSKNLYLAAIRTVFRQLFAWGVLPFDASKGVRAFEVANGHKRPPVTDAQVKAAFSYAERSSDKRLTLILNLLYRQGLRQKEVVDIRVEDFDEHAGTLAILGKGRDDREAINLHPETVRAIRAYLAESATKSGYILSSRKRSGDHLGTNALYKIVMEVHAACGITNSPHSWRKVFTSRLIDAGLNLLDVQAYTRHRSLGQLQVYYDRIAFRKSLPTYYAAFAEGETAT